MNAPLAVAEAGDRIEPSLAQLMREFFDPGWYLTRYPDIAAAELDPLLHFIRYGAAEKRDPNAFFDSAWYIEHHPDVAASGLNPLQHYLRNGAAELRNPHPRFDAAYYVDQHPAAAANPVLYHLNVGASRGYPTERSVNIRDYLPSQNTTKLPIPRGIFADLVIHVQDGLAETRRCIRSVLADRGFPLARIIVVDDRSSEPELSGWLRGLASDGEIHLIRNPRRLGFAASASLGIGATENHDVVLLSGDSVVPQGWLCRLAAHAHAQPNIASVSPFSNQTAISGHPDACAYPPERIDHACRLANGGRSVEVAVTSDHCIYIRRAALPAAGTSFGGDGPESDFWQRARRAGWSHRMACDTFVGRRRQASPTAREPRESVQPSSIVPFQFAATAAMFRELNLPVILMISHDFGGGVRRHIHSLMERYRDTARVLLLEGTDRGATLSIPSSSSDGVLTLTSDRLNELVTVLRSINVSRVHIHHLLRMDMDIRALIHRLGVPVDVTVHDYHAICPQINLLRWSEGIYCGEPGPAGCNACIAEQSSHGARDIVSWRRDRAWQFLDAERVICPSADVKARLDRHGLGERAIVVPHEQQTEATWATCLPRFTTSPLRIVLLGVLANHKGARAVAEVAEAASSGTIALHLIGHLEARFPKPARKLIKVTGEYRECDLAGLLKRIDPHVFWFPSSAAETYSFTLSTAIATGLPIVATDLGSFTERLEGRPHTWLVDHRASCADWLAVFEQVRARLHDRMDQPIVSRSCVVSDFYAKRYLSPAPQPNINTRARRPRVAIVPERYDSGGMTPCAYIRLLQPLDHLSAEARFDLVLADVENVFSCEADIIVTQRYAVPDIYTADKLARHASRTGAKLLYDLDDDLINVPDSHPDAAQIQPFAAVVARMLTLADAVWVSTAALAERLAPTRPDVTVIENRLDERIWNQSPAPPAFCEDPVRILCMGTSTHDRDFAMIEPVLLRLKAEYGDRIIIDVLGMTARSELPVELNRIGPSTHASRSYPGFVNWLTSIQPRWHIGLAPLLDTPFNRSKSPIKAMDYAAMGMAILASDTPAYRGSIADGAAGQLVANDHRAWHATLDWLIRNQTSRQSIATAAREAFLARSTLASHREARLAVWERLLPSGNLRDIQVGPIIPHGQTHSVARTRRHSGRRR